MNRWLVAMLLLSAATAQASQVVLEEAFEGKLDTQWVGKAGDGSVPMNATLVDDPLRKGNKVVRFEKGVFGGDAFSKKQFPLGQYKISFDYLGTCEQKNCGGVLGLTPDFPGARDQWLAGTAPSGFPNKIEDSGKWEHYEIEFTPVFPFHLALEKWVESKGSGGDVYFDNVKLIQLPASAAK